MERILNTTVGDVTSVVTKGTTPTTLGKSFTATGIGFIKAECISEDGSLIKEKQMFIDDETDQLLRRSRLQNEDVLFSIAGVIGRTALVNESVLPANTNQAIAILRPKVDVVDPRFLYYTVRSKDFLDHSLGHVVQTAQANVSLGVLSATPIWVPDLPAQRRIAGILSAYDELIANNQRRIAVLEEMARALYREWFVYFRAPGVVMKEGDAVPEGWDVGTLKDLLQFKSGFPFKSGTFIVDGEYGVVTIRNVQDGSFKPESDSRLNELPERLPQHCVLEDGDILLSLTGNVGRVCLVYGGTYLLNQRVAKLEPLNAFDWAMTYCMFRDTAMQVKLEQLSNGVAQQNLSPVLASKMEVVIPPRDVRSRFALVAEPMLRQVVQLYSMNQNLRRTRDLLLPRLMSGRVEVKALETEVQ